MMTRRCLSFIIISSGIRRNSDWNCLMKSAYSRMFSRINNHHNNKEMNSDGNKILDAIKRMAADDNKGLRMTTTIVDVKDDPRGSVSI